jgi:hypothetical protein
MTFLMRRLFAIDSFTLIRRDRKSGGGQAVGCFINNNLQWQRREDLELDSIEGIWLELLIKNSKSLLVFVVYRPPNRQHQNYLCPEFNEMFNDMLQVLVYLKIRKLLSLAISIVII